MLSRSRSTLDHHMNKLGRPHIPNVTYQVPRLSAFWFWRKRLLKGFYHIWACRPFWSCDQTNLHKNLGLLIVELNAGFQVSFNQLEDLKVLKRSPDLLNNVKIGQGQLRLIIQTYFVLPYMGNGHFDQVTQNNIIFTVLSTEYFI